MHSGEEKRLSCICALMVICAWSFALWSLILGNILLAVALGLIGIVFFFVPFFCVAAREDERFFDNPKAPKH